MFQRDGTHLVCQVPITVSVRRLWAVRIEVPTLDGAITHEIKRGECSPARCCGVAGKGMPSIRGKRRGDLHVELIVETPRSLTKRQEELFRELAEIDQKNVSPQRKRFLEQLKSSSPRPRDADPKSAGRQRFASPVTPRRSHRDRIDESGWR